MPAPYPLRLPFWNEKMTPPRVVWEDAPVLLASDIFHCLYMNYPASFQTSMLGGSQHQLEKYWQEAHPHDPRLANNPLRNISDFKKTVIPCAIWGDGVPWKKSGVAQSLDVGTTSSLLGIGDCTWDTRFLMWAFPHDILCTQLEHGVDTMKIVYELGLWDWRQLLNGIFAFEDAWGSTFDPQSYRGRLVGTQIMGPYRAALLQLRADLDWRFKVSTLLSGCAHVPTLEPSYIIMYRV
jgi:hypothetical protein